MSVFDQINKISVSCRPHNDSNSNTVRKTNHSKAKIKSWENEKVTDFQENIDEEKLYTFEQKLSRWQNEIGVTDQAIIDSLLEDLGWDYLTVNFILFIHNFLITLFIIDHNGTISYSVIQFITFLRFSILIINEYIKSISNRFIHIYEKRFDIIFDTGILPQCWLNGIIKPIY
jgi:hypothetical protein